MRADLPFGSEPFQVCVCGSLQGHFPSPVLIQVCALGRGGCLPLCRQQLPACVQVDPCECLSVLLTRLSWHHPGLCVCKHVSPHTCLLQSGRSEFQMQAGMETSELEAILCWWLYAGICVMQRLNLVMDC